MKTLFVFNVSTEHVCPFFVFTPFSAATEMSVIAQFVSVTSGEQTGPQIELPLDTNVTQLAQIVNKLLENVSLP